MHMTRVFLLCLLALVAPQLARAQAEARREYAIGAGDGLKITVFQSPELSLEARVNENGAITFPLLGQVRIGGLSVTQAEKTIADGLRTGNFLKQPQVIIAVSQVRAHQVSVLGLVGKPGRYPIETAGMRLSELIATAGGVAGDGSDLIALTGTRAGKPVRMQIDIAQLVAGANTDQDPVILNGDVVYIERMPMVYVYGEVGHPGSFRLERGMTVMQAIAQGGGLTQRGTLKGLKITRRDAGGKTRDIEPDLADGLLSGDVIYVRPSLF
jgi:polysaccharide export outer membrane protein